MSLPTAFSNNTSPTGPQLDGNFAAVGALTVIPCAVSGTNTLVLVPETNSPTVVAYANYGRYSGIATATNTTTTTARVGGLGALPVYLDTPAGPVVLAGGEIVSGCAFTLVYDSALNSGGGGFHLISTAAAVPFAGGTLTGPLLGPSGSFASLQIGATAATLSRMVTNIATLSFTVVLANSSQIQNMTLTGAAVNDPVLLGPPASVTSGLGFFGFVPAPGTVSVRCLNVTAASIAAFSVTMRASALGMA